MENLIRLEMSRLIGSGLLAQALHIVNHFHTQVIHFYLIHSQGVFLEFMK